MGKGEKRPTEEMNEIDGNLGELGFLVDQGHDVERFDGNQIQGVLVIDEFNVLPADVFLIILLLFQFEYVADEELLQILVGVIDAKLLEATETRQATR